MTTQAHNIVLTGFMASGKSRIGEMLAEILGYQLYDLDLIIEQEQKNTIKNIFSTHGELYFRALELALIKKLKNTTNSVIVSGGGAPTFFDSAQALASLGQVFYLDANFALIIKRLTSSNKRPLGSLASAAELEKLKQLYVFRRPLYCGLGSVIDVNHEDKKRTCDDIIKRFNAYNYLANIHTIRVHDINRPYKIYIGSNISDKISKIITLLGFDNYRIIVISNNNLANIFQEFITKIGADLIIIPEGEEHKNQASIDLIHERLLNLGCTRSTLIIALGGGNVGDVAGFAAATFMRGLPLIQVPTSLLAMVDSSVGGKTGIDTCFGKNLVGSFHNPQAVIIDLNCLASLPEEECAAGMAEIIKHAIIADPDLFYDLLNKKLEPHNLVSRAIKVKVDLVFADPQEKNIRAHLNLGHTFAHALEKVSHYQIRHGYAVAIGLMLAANLAHQQGLLQQDFRPELLSLLKHYNLPHELPKNINKTELIAAMQHDKKRDSHGLKFILPIKLGIVEAFTVPITNL